MFRPYQINKTSTPTGGNRIRLHLQEYNDIDDWCEPVPAFWNIPEQWKLVGNVVQHKRTRRVLTLVPRMPYYGYDEEKNSYVHLLSGYTVPKAEDDDLVYERK